MSMTIGVPEALADKVRAFVQAHSMGCEVVEGGGGTINVVQSNGSQQSDTSTLHAGGWIACPDGFALASGLCISAQALGQLLDELNIKVRQCQLGCF